MASIIKDIIGTEVVLGIEEDETYCIYRQTKDFVQLWRKVPPELMMSVFSQDKKNLQITWLRKILVHSIIKSFIESGNADNETPEAVKEAIYSADISAEKLFWGTEELDILHKCRS